MEKAEQPLKCRFKSLLRTLGNCVAFKHCYCYLEIDQLST